VSIVQLVGDQRSPVDLVATSTLTDAVVPVEPSSIAGGGVAEVWIEIPEVADEIPFSLTVASAGGAVLEPVTIDAVAVPGVDDLADQATEIAGLFIDRIEEDVPGLPADESGLVGGTPVAGLLVVTHYAWFTAEAEIGVAWHIMVAPDDFAELYVRPRSELRPTRAFRVSSWTRRWQAAMCRSRRSRRRPTSCGDGAPQRVDVEHLEPWLHVDGADGEQLEFDHVAVRVETHHGAGDTEVRCEDDVRALGEEVVGSHEIGFGLDLPAGVRQPDRPGRVGGIELWVLVQGEVRIPLGAGQAQEREPVLVVVGDDLGAEQVPVELDGPAAVGDIEGDVVE